MVMDWFNSLTFWTFFCCSVWIVNNLQLSIIVVYLT